MIVNKVVDRIAPDIEQLKETQNIILINHSKFLKMVADLRSELEKEKKRNKKLYGN